MKRGLNKDALSKLSETLAGSEVEIELDKVLEKSKRVIVKSLNKKSI